MYVLCECSFCDVFPLRLLRVVWFGCIARGIYVRLCVCCVCVVLALRRCMCVLSFRCVYVFLLCCLCYVCTLRVIVVL